MCEMVGTDESYMKTWEDLWESLRCSTDEGTKNQRLSDFTVAALLESSRPGNLTPCLGSTLHYFWISDFRDCDKESGAGGRRGLSRLVRGS